MRQGPARLAACDETAEAPVLTEERGKCHSSPAYLCQWNVVNHFPYGALPLRAIVGIGFLVHGCSKLSKGPDKRYWKSGSPPWIKRQERFRIRRAIRDLNFLPLTH
jgi:hypothetical protein